MSIPSSDAAYYSGDNTTRKPATATGADLSGQISYDGQRATGPNTSDRHLSPVAISDSGAATPPGKDCDFITTKFNAHKDASYEVTVRDGKIYITTENGQRETRPQDHHPANVAEQQRRNDNYYGTPAPPPQTYEQPYPPQVAYAPQQGFYPPPPQAFFPPPIQEGWGGRHERHGWGYPEPHRGFNVGGGIFGAIVGGILGFERAAVYTQPYPQPYQNAGYYSPNQMAYMPRNYPVVNPNYSYQQNNNTYAYANSGSYYSGAPVDDYTPSYDRAAYNGQRTYAPFYRAAYNPSYDTVASNDQPTTYTGSSEYDPNYNS
jgi:hypothetical protein